MRMPAGFKFVSLLEDAILIVEIPGCDTPSITRLPPIYYKFYVQ